MKRWIATWVFAAGAAAGTAQAADDLCKVNPYTKDEATQGKVLFESHCALCHQYSMAGRQPGNYRNESPDIGKLSESDAQFVDNSGGTVPPLLGAKFFDKYRGTRSLADFSAFVSSAGVAFPPAGKLEVPYTYFKVAAYVLYRNCGRAVGS